MAFAAFLLLAAHIASLRGFPNTAQAAAMSSAGARVSAEESAQMKQLMAIGVAAAVSAGASAQNAVQWQLANGGNGHWYRVEVVGAVTWESAKLQAESLGGRLACLESVTERSFCFERFSRFSRPEAWVAHTTGGISVFGPWIGGFQQANATEPLGGWVWLTGATFNPEWPWACCNNACNGSSNEDRLHLFYAEQTSTTAWNDLPNMVTCANQPISYLIEFDADCNNDGLVDYGQILSGELADANHNNIPDCCENGGSCSCPGDTNHDHSVDGIDLATVLTRWGQSAAKFPSADCNHDGVIDGADLALVLSSWGVCP